MLVLPGYSLKNKDWAYVVKRNLGSIFDVVVYEWKHWSDSNVNLNFNEEVVRIVGFTRSENKLNIIAKSIGTVVCMLLLDDLKERVNKIILCGICLNDLKEEDFSAFKILKSFDTDKIIVFQNNNDPHGNYQQVFAFLDKINPKIKIIEKEDDTHEYPYFEEFTRFFT